MQIFPETGPKQKTQRQDDDLAPDSTGPHQIQFGNQSVARKEAVAVLST